ncbi:MAG: ferritin [Actinobacteria bacterium HGW-Actinobacteria-10]|jgi:uncharacterized protein (TIGR02284 family)|nr:MAG: ferritin [Actinobacteria bacterium HGW-Actinobacteria-10]
MIMDRDDALEKLVDLVQLDIDAVEAYNEAIEKIDVEDVRARLSTYRDDHQRHVSEITEVIRMLGGEPPELETGMKGKLLEGMTALRSSMGTDSALKAMRMNEQLTNRTYEDAMDWEVPPEAHDVIRRGFEDERQHLAYIEQALSVGVGSSRSDY